jgi:D-aspartate ligase
VSASANPTTAQPDWPPAVIAGAFQTGVLGVRSLRRRGVRVASIDANKQNPGFRSVHGRAHLCPHPDTDGPGWLRAMIDFARTMGNKPALISSSDHYVSAIATYADPLAEHYILSPGASLQGLLADKQTQYALAHQHGMPMPRTKFATCLDEVTAFCDEASFPCLIKPTHFRVWQRFPQGHPLAFMKVSIAADADRLLANYRLASEVDGHVILQEIIQGPDTAKRVYLSCYDRDSRRFAHAMFRELRCDPIGFGPATISEPVEDEQTDAVCDRFLRSIGYAGICEIEMKWDERDGKVKLIEANPRLSGGGDAAPYAGVDLCWLHYLDLIGQRVEEVGPDGSDFRHIVVRAEARSLPSYWRAGLVSWRDLARSYRPPLAFYDLDRRDWRYSAETLLASASVFVKSCFARTPS